MVSVGHYSPLNTRVTCKIGILEIIYPSEGPALDGPGLFASSPEERMMDSLLVWIITRRQKSPEQFGGFEVVALAHCVFVPRLPA